MHMTNWYMWPTYRNLRGILVFSMYLAIMFSLSHEPCILKVQAIAKRCYRTFGVKANIMPASVTHDVSSTFSGTIGEVLLSHVWGQSSLTMCRLNLNFKILGEILASHTSGSVIIHHVQAES